MTYADAQAASAKEAQEPWYSASDNVYTGCAMPIGRKAECWRESFFRNLHEGIQYRSLQDCLLRDFAEVERQYLELAQAYNGTLNDCDLVCPRGPWRPRRAQWCRKRWSRARLNLTA